MSLSAQIQSDMKEALKNKQPERLEALRLLVSAVNNLKIQRQGKPLEDADFVRLIQKQVKVYQDIVQQYVSAGRKDEGEKEIIKMEWIKEYLPPPMTKEQLAKLVSEVIVAIKAKGIEDQGLVIKEVRKKTGGSVDNVQMVHIVREHLQQL